MALHEFGGVTYAIEERKEEEQKERRRQAKMDAALDVACDESVKQGLANQLQSQGWSGGMEWLITAKSTPKTLSEKMDARMGDTGLRLGNPPPKTSNKGGWASWFG